MDNLGNKGSVWNWQRMVVSLLTNILAALGGGSGVQKTPTLTRTSVAGTVAAGAISVSVYNAGNANGTVLGQTIKPGESFTWSTYARDTLAAVAYNGTGTELVITKI